MRPFIRQWPGAAPEGEAMASGCSAAACSVSGRPHSTVAGVGMRKGAVPLCP